MKMELDTFWRDWLLLPVCAVILVQAIIWLAGAFVFLDIWWLSPKLHRALLVFVLFWIYWLLIADALEAME
jgi:uncharacterized membrane protein YqhA